MPKFWDDNANNWIEFVTEEKYRAFIALNFPNPSNLANYAKFEEHEAIGKNLVRELFITLRGQNLTQAQEGDLLSRIYPVLGCLADGFIRGARVICNATATGGEFTAQRKTYLLNQIDAAIAKL